MQNSVKTGENPTFPTVNPHSEHFTGFENTRLMDRLQKKFTPKPYWKQYGLLRNVVFGVSFLFHVLSAATAAALVFFFLRGLVGNDIAAGVLTAVALAALELTKRETSGRFFSGYFQFRKMSGGLLAAIVLLMAISTAASYFGAKRAVHELTPPPVAVSADSLTAPLQAQVAAIDQQIRDARKMRYKGKITAQGQTAVANLTEQKGLVLAEIARIQSRTDGKNDATEQAHTAETKINAAGFGAFTLTCEILLVLALFWLEYYDYRSFAERCQPQTDTAKNPATTAPPGQRSAGTGAPYILQQPPIVNGHSPHNTTPRRTIGFHRPPDDNAMSYRARDNAMSYNAADRPQNTKDCAQCGQPFQYRTTWQKFCSDGCKLDYHEAKRGSRFDPTYKRKAKATAV